MKGKIIAVPFPFTNLKGAKVRPALVIYEGREDVIVAFISSKIPAERYNVDVLLTSQMPVFRHSGLKRDSVIQLNTESYSKSRSMKTDASTTIIASLNELRHRIPVHFNPVSSGHIGDSSRLENDECLRSLTQVNIL